MELFRAVKIANGYTIEVRWPALLVIVLLWVVLGFGVHALDRGLWG